MSFEELRHQQEAVAKWTTAMSSGDYAAALRIAEAERAAHPVDGGQISNHIETLLQVTRRAIAGSQAGTPPFRACSFCACDEHSVGVLVAGPGVFICERCVELCSKVVEQIKQGQRPPRPKRPRGNSP